VTAAAQMISEGKYPEALSSLEASLKIFDSHIAHRYMGEIYLQLGNNTKALYHLNRVYSEFSFDPEFLTDLIFLYSSMDEFQKAEDLLMELKRIDPHSDSISTLAQMLLQAQR